MGKDAYTIILIKCLKIFVDEEATFLNMDHDNLN